MKVDYAPQEKRAYLTVESFICEDKLEGVRIRIFGGQVVLERWEPVTHRWSEGAYSMHPRKITETQLRKALKRLDEERDKCK